MRREKISMLILTVTCMLAGCGGEKTPEVSSLSIDKEGKVSHQIVGQFEQEYYEKDGLMSLAQERGKRGAGRSGRAGRQSADSF